jgi:hypothetical protein
MGELTFLIRIIQINSCDYGGLYEGNKTEVKCHQTLTVRCGLATRNNVPVPVMLPIPLLVLLLLKEAATTPPPQPAPSWGNSRAPVNQQVGKHCRQSESLA